MEYKTSPASMVIRTKASERDNRQSYAPLFIGMKKRRRQMALLMLAADLLGFGLGISLSLLINRFVNFFLLGSSDFRYAIIPIICILLFVNSKLYPGIGINPAEEIRLVTQFTSSGFLIGLLFYSAIQSHGRLNIYAFAAAGIICICMVLLLRWAIRIAAVQLGLWGEAVVIIGYEQNAEKLAGYFLSRQRLGFVPVLVAQKTDNSIQSSALPIPVISLHELLAAEGALTRDIQTVLVDFPAVSDMLKADFANRLNRSFDHIIFVSDMAWLEGATLHNHDFEGLLGIEARKNGLNPFETLLKRVLDIGLTVLVGLVLLPLFILVALAIRLDSPGPIFYTQERLGKAGRKIKIYKFRSMMVNSEAILEAYFREHLDALDEWERNQKLPNDPRVTRAGQWLRRFSVDELPQLFNVLKGEMSLVGPRPMMLNQEERYGDKIDAYYAVPPGMTGMWQVSGRNHTTFEERAQYDLYYVRNWSIWLDIYILARTVWVVINREGAY